MYTILYFPLKLNSQTSTDSTYVAYQSSNAPSTNDTPIRFSSVLPTLTLGPNGHNYNEGVVPNLAYRTTAAAFAAPPKMAKTATV